MRTGIKPKEKLFCRLVADGYSPQDAAVRAELGNQPKRIADRLMQRPEVRECIRSFADEDAMCSAVAGYRRLAFGSVADAVKLCLNQQCDDIDGLDMFCVQELKRTEKGVEVKFFDRMKALDRLSEFAGAKKDSALSFYRALEEGARRLGGENDEL